MENKQQTADEVAAAEAAATPEVEEAETDAPKSEEAPSSEEDNSKEGESDEKDGEVEIDYKAELEKIQTALTDKTKQAEKIQFNLDKKVSEITRLKREKPEESDDEEDADVGDDVEARVQEVLKRAEEQHRLNLATDNVESELATYDDNPDRQALVRHHYENTINRSGYARADIKRDLETAAFLADRPKFESRMSEVNKAIAAEQSKKKGGVAAGVRDGEDVAELNLSARDKAILNRAGLTEKDVIENIKG